MRHSVLITHVISQEMLLELALLSRRLVLSLALSSSSSFSFLSPNEVPMSSFSSSQKWIRLAIHGGDNMLGRAVQLTFPAQAVGEELIRDSCTSAYYLDKALHQHADDNDDSQQQQEHLSINNIRQQNANEGSYLWDKSRFQMNPKPDVCLLNLETAVTKSIANDDIPKFKGINYHMHVDNFETIMSGFPFYKDNVPIVVGLANNHCMDYGRKALDRETLPFFQNTNMVQMVGCGSNFAAAARPVVIEPPSDKPDKTQIEIFAVAAGCSGTPYDWWATDSQSSTVPWIGTVIGKITFCR